MKTLWNKLPAWLQAILLNVILLIPPIAIVQNTAKANLTILPEYGWSLLVTILVLFIYWRLVKRLTNFTDRDDIKMSLTFNYRKLESWALIAGIMCVTAGIIQLSSFLLNSEAERQISFFEQFNSHGPLMAIPVFFGLCLTAGIVEEVTYRYVMQNVLVRAYGRWIGIGIVAVIFAVIHFLPLALILPYMIVSVFISLVSEKERSIGLVVAAHFGIDFVFYLLGYLIPEAPISDPLLMNLVWLVILAIGIALLFTNLKGEIKTRKLSFD